MVYPALLPLMDKPRLPVVDRTDAPADLNGLVRFLHTTSEHGVSSITPADTQTSAASSRQN